MVTCSAFYNINMMLFVQVSFVSYIHQEMMVDRTEIVLYTQE